MHADCAVDEAMRQSIMPFSTLKGDANLIVCPNIDSANISYNLLKATAGNNIAIGPDPAGRRQAREYPDVVRNGAADRQHDGVDGARGELACGSRNCSSVLLRVAPCRAAGAAARRLGGVRAGRRCARAGPAVSAGEVALADLPREARDTLALIRKGGPFPYRKDGSTFGNREGHLPQQPRGYYTEYTVHTPWERDRGARRIVAGRGGTGRSGDQRRVLLHRRSLQLVSTDTRMSRVRAQRTRCDKLPRRRRQAAAGHGRAPRCGTGPQSVAASG